jgi:hypothetical protein
MAKEKYKMTENKFAIDPHALDQECIVQPELIWDTSRRLATAKRNLSEAEIAFTEFKEKLSGHVRNKPEKYKIFKLTEAAVTNAVKSHPEYKNHQQGIIDLTFIVDSCWADVHAAQAKQQSLTDLVKLHGQQYFSEPVVDERGVEAIKKDKARRKGVKRE